MLVLLLLRYIPKNFPSQLLSTLHKGLVTQIGISPKFHKTRRFRIKSSHSYPNCLCFIHIS
jgi:hypothetical protein